MSHDLRSVWSTCIMSDHLWSVWSRRIISHDLWSVWSTCIMSDHLRSVWSRRIISHDLWSVWSPCIMADHLRSVRDIIFREKKIFDWNEFKFSEQFVSENIHARLIHLRSILLNVSLCKPKLEAPWTPACCANQEKECLSWKFRQLSTNKTFAAGMQFPASRPAGRPAVQAATSVSLHRNRLQFVSCNAFILTFIAER